jgi:hypothetical protein
MDFHDDIILTERRIRDDGGYEGCLCDGDNPALRDGFLECSDIPRTTGMFGRRKDTRMDYARVEFALLSWQIGLGRFNVSTYCANGSGGFARRYALLSYRLSSGRRMTVA